MADKFIKCVDDSQSTKMITNGKLYKVVDESSEYYYINANDGQIKAGFHKNRFKEVTIKGYNLKTEFKEFQIYAALIASANIINYFPNGAGCDIHSDAVDRIQKAGLLDLWFEPVEGHRFKMGDWITVDTPKFESWPSHWLTETTKRTFQIQHQREFLTDSEEAFDHGWCWGVETRGNYIPDGWFRLATPKEISGVSSVIVVLSSGIEVDIHVGKIEAAGKEITIGGLKSLYEDFTPQEWSGIPWMVYTVGNVKIGCTEVTKEDLEFVIITYEQLERGNTSLFGATLTVPK